jgi:hypothetical protein
MSPVLKPCEFVSFNLINQIWLVILNAYSKQHHDHNRVTTATDSIKRDSHIIFLNGDNTRTYLDSHFDNPNWEMEVKEVEEVEEEKEVEELRVDLQEIINQIWLVILNA